jgi:hypothetical protein
MTSVAYGFRINTNAKAAMAEVDSLTKTMKEMDQVVAHSAGTVKSAGTANDAYVASLVREANILGMTTSQVRLYDLAAKGLNQTQRLQAVSSLALIQSHEKQAASMAAMASIGLRMGNVIGLAIAAVAGVATAGVVKVTNLGESFADLSEKSGRSAQDLSALRFIAAQANTSFEEVAKSGYTLSKGISAASRGSGTAELAFKALNIEVKNADGSLRSSESVMLDIADRFKDMTDYTTKAALAQMLFKDGGAAIERAWKNWVKRRSHWEW